MRKKERLISLIQSHSQQAKKHHEIESKYRDEMVQHYCPYIRNEQVLFKPTHYCDIDDKWRCGVIVRISYTDDGFEYCVIEWTKNWKKENRARPSFNYITNVKGKIKKVNEELA